MTDEEILEGLKAYTSKPEVIDKAVKAIENEQKQKTILKEIVGRQAATQALIEWYGELSYEEMNDFSKILDKHMENNEKLYVEMCENDFLCSKLKEAIQKIKESLKNYETLHLNKETSESYAMASAYNTSIDVINKHTEGLI